MDVHEEAREVLRRNRRTTSGHQYTVPAPDTYPYQWLWDSCFHAIALATFEPEAGAAELRSLVTKQFENGMIPHMIYWEPSPLYDFAWGTSGTSALTQPPMLAYAARAVADRLPDGHAFLEELFPSMIAFYRFLVDKRDPRDHHLIGIINPDESGEDNSPRFDAILHVPPDIALADHLKRRLELVDANRTCNFDAERCMRKYFWAKDVPFNAIMIENLRSLEGIARELAREDDARFCALNADLIARAMHDLLFADGIYWSAKGIDYEKLRVATWAHFAPLFAGLYSPDEARCLIEEHFTDETTFRSPWGIRTTSAKEPSYRPDGFWRGPVWMAPHWFIYHGLIRYGFNDEAAWIRERSEALLAHSGFREYFDPETGQGCGAHDFTWGALILAMMS
ncbi:MAG TPA: hypothetical protein VFL98_03440 [Candidatus Paceibacterota bacterium]|nr:hypothetical protein [Candidatus Paceibacterota bacterium]